jgi:hypothetical protein
MLDEMSAVGCLSGGDGVLQWRRWRAERRCRRVNGGDLSLWGIPTARLVVVAVAVAVEGLDSAR